MKQRSLTLILVLSAFGHASAEEPVYFEDSNLKTVVEETLWVWDPTPSDMVGFTILDATSRDISSLVGLEHATNLMTLWLGDNQWITDVSPLAGLTNLTQLVLNQNRIADISPLSELVNLWHLDIHHNQITDISALSRMTRLRRLSLRENRIRDISVLSGLTSLDDLILSLTEVSDLTALLGLTRLSRLDVRGCPLDPSTVDAHLAQIRANNPGIYLLYDTEYYHRVVFASSYGGSVTSPGEGPFSYRHGRNVFLAARANPGFMFFYWSGRHRGTENPTSVTISSSGEIRAHFLDLSRSLFVDDSGPYDFAPGDPTGSDPLEDGTLRHPFDRIQEAIDRAIDGTSIFVRPGTYFENIDLLGKSIRVTGISPDDPNAAPYPVIAGVGAGPVVSFTGGEDPNCVVSGFVITHGKGMPAGAIHCHAASPTITNCLIVGNCATGPNGGAVTCVDSRAVLANCTIADNVAGDNGAGICLVDSDIVLTHSIVWGNGPNEILLAGTSAPTIAYTDIASGWSGPGIIDEDPLFAVRGYWLDPDDLSVVLEPKNADVLWIPGDYHLRSPAGRHSVKTANWHLDNLASPCIDAGDPNRPVGAEPAPNGGILNLGAYGGTTQASKSPTHP